MAFVVYPAQAALVAHYLIIWWIVHEQTKMKKTNHASSGAEYPDMCFYKTQEDQ
jgi:hypothetical protein